VNQRVNPSFSNRLGKNSSLAQLKNVPTTLAFASCRLAPTRLSTIAVKAPGKGVFLRGAFNYRDSSSARGVRRRRAGINLLIGYATPRPYQHLRALVLPSHQSGETVPAMQERREMHFEESDSLHAARTTTS